MKFFRVDLAESTRLALNPSMTDPPGSAASSSMALQDGGAQRAEKEGVPMTFFPYEDPHRLVRPPISVSTLPRPEKDLFDRPFPEG